MVLCTTACPSFPGVYTTKQQTGLDAASNLSFRRRGDVEKDPTYKQIIPYLIVSKGDGRILTYKRGKSGGEARLHDLYTFGVGGHINSKDAEGTDFDHIDLIYFQAIHRELTEEIGLGLGHFKTFKHIGWISLDATEVDKVHLGKIYYLRIGNMFIDQIKPEDCLNEISWKQLDDLEGLNMEDWSKYILTELPRLINVS
jgi:predicted NUDIX family phosphoesterase